MSINKQFRIHCLRELNEKDFQKKEFYKKFPFYKIPKDQKRHMKFFQDRIDKRNKEISELQELLPIETC